LADFASLRYLSSPLILLVGALLALVLDVIVRPKRVARVAWATALLSVIGAMALDVTAWTAVYGLTSVPSGGSVRVFAVLTYDGFTVYIWRLTLLAIMMILLLGESYVRAHIHEPGLYYACLLFLGLGALLLAAASHLVMLLLGLAFLSLVGYVLAGFLRGDKRATEAAIKYLVYGSVLLAVMAYGLSWLYGVAGSGDYGLIAERLVGGGEGWASNATLRPLTFVPILVFILAGFSFKIGAAPFHQWSPDAAEGAPAPVSAALAVVPRLAGFAALTRFTVVVLPAGTTLGGIWRWPLAALLAIVAMFVGNLMGLWQVNIKRLMAYSGIAQVGYALIGVAVATQRGLSALLFALTAYVLAEMGVFAVITVVSDREGAEKIDDYRGLHHRAPLLSGVLLVSILSLFGMPGTGGFMGKLWLLTASLEAGRLSLLVILALSSVTSLFTYWKIIRPTLLQTDKGLETVAVPFWSRVALAISVIGVVGMGLSPNVVLRWAEAAIRSLL
jgi:NADH-quinone oxidoreductase subunit N